MSSRKLRTIHVILSLSSALVRDAVRHVLEENEFIRVIAEVSSPMELLCNTELQHTDAVIIESDDALEMPGVVSHLVAEFPQIVAVVVGRRSNRVVVYRQQLDEHVYEDVSLAELLRKICAADADY